MTTPAPAAVPAAAAGYPQWEVLFLNQLGAPLTATNFQALSFWAQSEGTTGSNNPLAISGIHPGSTTCLAQCGSSSPVMAYDTMANGVAANVAFLQGSYYDGVRAAFINDSGLAAIWASINQSPWCAGCQSGKYPNAIYSHLSDTSAAAAEAAQAAAAALTTNANAAAADATLTGVNLDPRQLIPGYQAASTVSGLIQDITRASFWKRVGMGVLGVTLFGVGLVVFFEGTDTGQKITSEAVQGAALAAVA